MKIEEGKFDDELNKTNQKISEKQINFIHENYENFKNTQLKYDLRKLK